MGKKLKTRVVVILCCIALAVLSGTAYHKFQHWRRAQIQAKAARIFENAEQLRLEKKYPEAIQEYRTIIEKYPQYDDLPEAYFKIANIYMYQIVNIVEARKFYEELLKRKGKFLNHRRIPDTLIELALIYRAQQKYQEAIAFLEEARNKYPGMIDQRQVYYQLFILYGQIGDKKKMEEMFLKRGEL